MDREKKPAIFLDRDGVIIVEKNFLKDPEEIEFYPGAIEALKAIGDEYIKIVISNQSGVARGYFTSADVEKINTHISSILKMSGISIDAWYFCPHGPDDNCQCRKPRPGMIMKAEEKFNINIPNSWIIGDKSTDIEAGKAAGINTILVKTGYGGSEPGASDIASDYLASDIGEAIKYINGSIQ